VDSKKEWDEKHEKVKMFYPNSLRINKYLQSLSAQVYQLAIKLNEQAMTWSDVDLKSIISGKVEVDFISFGSELYDHLVTREKVRTAKRYRTTLNKIGDYRKGRALHFSEITVSFLNKYEAYLAGIGNKINTIHSDMKTIRVIYHEAIRQGLASQEQNPFTRFKLKQEIPHKVRPSAEDFDRIKNASISSESLHLYHTRNAYLFSLYCAGIRVGDLLQLTYKNINNDLLSYTMDKTRDPRLVKLTSPALKILEEYKDRGASEPIFPFLSKEDLNNSPTQLLGKISSMNAVMNRALKQIVEIANVDKPLTMHTARHGFSELARKKKIDVYNISKALGHSTLSITESYLKSFDMDSMSDTMTTIFE